MHAGATGGGGKRFFCTVLDEFTRHMWTIPVRSKGEFADKLVELLHQELKDGVELHRLQRDGATEYVTNAFGEFIRTEGVAEVVVPRYDHNGVGLI